MEGEAGQEDSILLAAKNGWKVRNLCENEPSHLRFLDIGLGEDP
jgi:hypothetical protein